MKSDFWKFEDIILICNLSKMHHLLRNIQKTTFKNHLPKKFLKTILSKLIMKTKLNRAYVSAFRLHWHKRAGQNKAFIDLFASSLWPHKTTKTGWNLQKVWKLVLSRTNAKEKYFNNQVSIYVNPTVGSTRYIKPETNIIP